jgi:hypothetical protein
MYLQVVRALRIGAAIYICGQFFSYFNGLNEARANGQAYDAEARRCLHEFSLELTGLS